MQDLFEVFLIYHFKN